MLIILLNYLLAMGDAHRYWILPLQGNVIDLGRVISKSQKVNIPLAPFAGAHHLRARGNAPEYAITFIILFTFFP